MRRAVRSVAPPPNHTGMPPVCSGAGRHHTSVERHGGRCERGGRVTPEHPAGGHRVVEALLAIGPPDAAGPELLALPARPDPEVEAPARDHVERRRRLRQQHRGPQRRDQDSGAETNPRRHAGHGGEHDERLGPRLLGRIGKGAERIAVGASDPSRRDRAARSGRRPRRRRRVRGRAPRGGRSRRCGPARTASGRPSRSRPLNVVRRVAG